MVPLSLWCKSLVSMYRIEDFQWNPIHSYSEAESHSAQLDCLWGRCAWDYNLTEQSYTYLPWQEMPLNSSWVDIHSSSVDIHRTTDLQLSRHTQNCGSEVTVETVVSSLTDDPVMNKSSSSEARSTLFFKKVIFIEDTIKIILQGDWHQKSYIFMCWRRMAVLWFLFIVCKFL